MSHSTEVTSSLKIEGYHAHFYCTAEEIPLCKEIRTQFVHAVRSIGGAGPVRSTAIGPHPLPMFEAWFEPHVLDEVLRWAMKNRRGLSVMIHPLSGDDYTDHAEHAIWLGEKLKLKLEIFREND